jgi:dolichyl-diphosphooligosaccharide--protein glycosyltransferase
MANLNQPMLPLPRNLTILILPLCIMFVYGLSYYQRHAGYAEWMSNRNAYVVDQVTAMSTLDSYHWIKMARDLDNGKLGSGKPDPLKAYPDNYDYPDRPSLLAHFISLASHLTGGDYYQGALLLPPLLAGLFVFPLFLYCSTLGFGSAAVLGGLIGSFSIAYHSRSNHGYVDTDMLNLFFPLLISAFIALIGKERSPRVNLLLAGAAGATMFLFNWWYQLPLFFLLYLPFIACHLVLARINRRQIPILLLVFTLFTGPHNVWESAASLTYFINSIFFPNVSGQITWPDIFMTIVEAQHLSVFAKLERVHGLIPLVLAGFAGLTLLYILRWRQLAPITPILLIGLWSLAGQRRFLMYLAPFIGIGIGVLIAFAAERLLDKTRIRQQVTQTIAAALMILLFFSTTGYTAYHIVPGALPDGGTLKAILEVKQRVPKHSAMFTWWDTGYPLMEVGEFATYHDGALHGGLRTTLAGKAFSSHHQEEMVSLLAYLEEHGFTAADSLAKHEAKSGPELMQRIFSHPPVFRGRNVYVLYTEHMIRTFSGISLFGAWDFDKPTQEPLLYEYMTCFSINDSAINCREAKVDLAQGIITDGTNELPLKAVVFVNDGMVVDTFSYAANVADDYLQVVMKNGLIFEVQVLEERLFRTNFNQQFILGNYDRRYFEEVYNNFPVARVFRVRTPPN